MKKILCSLCFVLLCGARLSAAPPDNSQLDATQVYAWYRDDGLEAKGNSVTAWKSANGESARDLDQIVGTPRLARVQTPTGQHPILALDGFSALWQKVGQWGVLDGDRTVVVMARLPEISEGFLFDGSTGTGLNRAQVRSGTWQVGVQEAAPSAIANSSKADSMTSPEKLGQWQLHAFAFHPENGGITVTHTVDGVAKEVHSKAQASLGGFILGANGAAQRGLNVQVAEVLVFNRIVAGADLQAVTKYLQTKWGTPTPVAVPANQNDDTTKIADLLADRSKPLIWVFSGIDDSEKTLGAQRNEAEHFAERVRWEMNRRRDVVINTTVTDEPTGALLQAFESRVARFHPAVVVLTPSASEATSNITALVSRVRKIGAIPILQANTANAVSVKQVAAESHILLVQPSTSANTPANPTKKVTASLFELLGIADPKSATTRFVTTN